jgi:hypothetical protein
MTTSFETLSHMLRWWPINDTCWQMSYKGYLCLVMYTDVEDEGYAAMIVCEGEVWLRASDLCKTMDGAKAWCVDKLTIL